jgi:hypothetical protein
MSNNQDTDFVIIGSEDHQSSDQTSDRQIKSNSYPTKSFRCSTSCAFTCGIKVKPELLEFMGLPKNSYVSRIEALTSINKYINSHNLRIKEGPQAGTIQRDAVLNKIFSDTAYKQQKPGDNSPPVMYDCITSKNLVSFYKHNFLEHDPVVHIHTGRKNCKGTNDAPVDTATNDAPVDPATNDAPVDPATNDAPVDPATNDAPIDTATNDAPIDTATNDAPIDTATNDAPIDTATNDAPVDPATNDAKAILTIDNLIVNGSILDATEDYICYLANGCGSDKTVCGLAKKLFEKYPYANIYSSRKYNAKNNKYAHDDWIILPGNICEFSNGDQKLIALVAQFTPGNPFNYTHHGNIIQEDSYIHRIQWFKDCLDLISGIDDVTSIALPYQIGCSEYSKGDWNVYSQSIVDFANNNKDIRVVIYKDTNNIE